MRFTLAAAALLAGFAAAEASPIVRSLVLLDGEVNIETVHHKPGHKGGPQSARERSESRFEARTAPRSTCRTTTQTQYDPYRGYVQRQVQVCDTY